MLEKFFTTISFLFIVSLAFSSCQPKDKFDWNAGLSGPKNYPSGAPFVEFFYKGKSIGGASSSTGADQGWGITSGGYVGGDKYKEVPDSISVKWVCSVDNLVYKAGKSLPREKILNLFKEGIRDSHNKKNNYTVIVTGMAPGGNVTLWLQAGRISTEVFKFKTPKGMEDPNIDDDYKTKEFKYWGDYLTYWYLHGIPYKVWEVGEKEYNYDVGFASEGDLIKPNIITFLSKDGSWYQPTLYNTEHSIEIENWANFIYLQNNNDIKKSKLPIQINAEWKFENKYYNTSIVLPIDFDKYFKKQEYDRILICVDRNNIFGKICVEGKKGRSDIMNFKIFEAKEGDMTTYISGGYSLPKGFVFPKWEGRIPISLPENFEYYQEP